MLKLGSIIILESLQPVFTVNWSYFIRACYIPIIIYSLVPVNQPSSSLDVGLVLTFLTPKKIKTIL